MRIALVLLLSFSAVVWGEERRSAPLTAASNHFVVRSYVGGPPASELVRSCEELRSNLAAAWLKQTSPSSWRPRCEVVVHASRANYQKAVGRGGGQTYGSSLIRFDRGQVAVRRIDLLVNAEGQVTALPHELAHVVLADRFSGRQPPRWVDEGVATLADDWEKRRLHHRDCQYALHAGTAFPLSELLRLQQCSSQEQMAAFYGQSLSLVGYLVERESPETFLGLVELAMAKGYNHALRETYGIEDLSALEREWREFALASLPSANAMRLTAWERSSK